MIQNQLHSRFPFLVNILSDSGQPGDAKLSNFQVIKSHHGNLFRNNTLIFVELFNDTQSQYIRRTENSGNVRRILNGLSKMHTGMKIDLIGKHIIFADRDPVFF